MENNMTNKRTIHIAAGLHQYFKVECVKRNLLIKDEIERLIINQLDKWMIEDNKNKNNSL